MRTPDQVQDNLKMFAKGVWKRVEKLEKDLSAIATIAVTNIPETEENQT